MKLRVIRFSGKPVSVENLNQYEQEFKVGYDKIQEECAQDMLKFHEELQKLDKQLDEKWSKIESQEMPKTAKAWKELLSAYEAPIMVAKSSENEKEIVLVVMDQPLA